MPQILVYPAFCLAAILVLTGAACAIGPGDINDSGAVAQEKKAAVANQGPVPIPVPRPTALGLSAAPPLPLAGSAGHGAIPPGAGPSSIADPSSSTGGNADPAIIVRRANAALNSIVFMTASFVQVGADARQSEGKLYVHKPGRLRFDYEPPSSLEIVSDGTSVAIRDRKLATQDVYFVNQTPLKFLLKERIDLAKDLRLLDVGGDGYPASVHVEDKSTFGGTSRIRLVFDPVSFALRQWIVLDPQGNTTIVTLSDVDMKTPPDPSLFRINYERVRE
jgi:outer membrane lipoprotein-sorting protein